MAYTIGLYEFAKLFAFYTSFAEHKGQKPAINIKLFVVMNYLGQDLNNNDDKKDNQLTFKNYHAPLRANLFFVTVRHNYDILFVIAEPVIDIPYRAGYISCMASSKYDRPPCYA